MYRFQKIRIQYIWHWKQYAAKCKLKIAAGWCIRAAIKEMMFISYELFDKWRPLNFNISAHVHNSWQVEGNIVTQFIGSMEAECH